MVNENEVPVKLVLNEKKCLLELYYSTGTLTSLSYEFLRVHSPSAEVVGHGPGQATLQTGKKNIKIIYLNPVGNYALRPEFSDGHSTGIYSWKYLKWLIDNKEGLWDKYLKKIESEGASRI
ncbi:MAG: hypothetical protein CBD16_07975 [Betaproteobacteria bacterium TMED156]|nr:MAG: hypothetical protein CBD16_07975 [Betaproteobacteria bacterium TMED156]|tara:strand:+ start:759 stop:1121 length:363 start_codon:yes stop_codon:yes gene_type:complete